jgi:hypothetical protein
MARQLKREVWIDQPCPGRTNLRMLIHETYEDRYSAGLHLGIRVQ